MDCAVCYDSPLGRLTLTASDAGLTGAWLPGQKYAPDPLPPAGEETAVLAAARQWLDEYFAGTRPAPDRLPLCPRGSAFRQAVWQCLLCIPYGQTVSYGALARQAAARLGREKLSARAVGGAVGHNPLSIFVPCHRVVGADGSLTGYAGGLEKKRWLLRWEGAALSCLYAPDKAAPQPGCPAVPR